MADIIIETQSGMGMISVDGQKLRNVVSFGVDVQAGHLPVVTVNMAAFESSLDLSGAALKIGGIEAPEALERAMLDYLLAKYPQPVPSPAGLRSMVADMVADWLKPPVESFGVDCARGADWTEIGEVVRLGDDWKYVPLNGVGRQCPATSCHPAASTAPAGLIRVATDGERNGRLGWVPGAAS